jgi:sugar lactone lactonase YvrE
MMALAAAVLLVFVSGTAQGANVTVFSDNLAGWTAAAGAPVIIEDFEDATLAGGLVITFGTSLPGIISGGLYHDRADSGAEINPKFTFTPAIKAFGANWNLFVPTGPGTRLKLHLTFADATEMDVATEIPNTFEGQFFGIVSDTAIVSIRFDEGGGDASVETFDMDNARFVPFDSSVITTVAENLNFPFGVADGSIYIADRNNHKVWKIGTGPTDLILVAGTGEAGYNGDGILATTAQLNSPTGVAVANGNLFIADSGNHIVRKVVLSSGMITTVAGIPQKNGPAVNGGSATQATLFGPRGVATDAAGNIYIADTMNQQIRKVVATGVDAGKILAVAGVAGETGSNDGPVASARLNSPLGVAVDSSGSVVVIADEGNDLVRVVDEGGVATVEAGTLDSPSGVAMGSDGTLYIADTDNHRIRRVSGESVTTVAGNGTPGFSGDGGPATSAQLNTPVGVAINSSGRFLYIADLINNRIRKVDFTPDVIP